MSKKDVNDSKELDAEVEAEKRKISQLFREIKAKGNDEDTKLNWMYKNPTEVVSREEYLLGRSVDKALDSMSGKPAASSTSQLANLGKRVVGAAPASGNLGEHVDLARKAHEDPLFAIRQREMAARKQLLNNPLKVKQLKLLVEAEAKKKRKIEKSMEKEAKKKQREAKVNSALIKTLRKFEGKIDIKLLIESSDDSSSDSEDKAKTTKKRIRKKRQSSISSGEESEEQERHDKRKRQQSSSRSQDAYKSSSRSGKADSGSSRYGKNNSSKGGSEQDNKRVRQRDARSPNYQETRHRSSQSSKTEDRKRNERNNDLSERKRRKRRVMSNSQSESSDDEKLENKVKLKKNKKQKKSKYSDLDSDTDPSSCEDSSSDQRKHAKDDRRRKRDDKESRRCDKRSKKGVVSEKSIEKESNQHKVPMKHKKYGLSTIDGTEPDVSEKAIVPYSKKEKLKPVVVSKRTGQLTEAEREAELQEMLENAKWRKQIREQDVSRHRKTKLNEDQIQRYDDSFMKNQLSRLTSHGSMADRIKSNINNIQRSESSMHSSFVRK